MKKKYEVGGDDLGTYWYIFTGYELSDALQTIWKDAFFRDEFVFKKYPYIFIDQQKKLFGKKKITVYLSKMPLDEAPVYQINEFTIR